MTSGMDWARENWRSRTTHLARRVLLATYGLCLSAFCRSAQISNLLYSLCTLLRKIFDSLTDSSGESFTPQAARHWADQVTQLRDPSCRQSVPLLYARMPASVRLQE